MGRTLERRRRPRVGRVVFLWLGFLLMLGLVPLAWWAGSRRPRAIAGPSGALAAELVADDLGRLQDRASEDARLPVPLGAVGASVAGEAALPLPEVVALGARAVDADGHPLAGVELFLPDVAAAPSGYTAADGVVQVECPWELLEDARLRATSVLLRGPGVATAGVALRFEGPGVVDLGDVRLDPGGGVAGRVVDEVGLPLEGARVFAVLGVAPEDPSRELLRVWGGRRLGLEASTGVDGRYKLEGVPDAIVSVAARTRSTFYAHGAPLAIRPGAVVEAGDLALEPAEQSHLVEGRVRGPDGRPVGSAVVQLYTPNAAAFLQGALTDDDGGFSFIVFPGQRYEVEAVDPARRWEAVRVGDVEAGALDVVLAFDRPLERDAAAEAAAHLPDPEVRETKRSRPRVVRTTEGGPGEARLEGRFLLDGQPPAGWTVESVGAAREYDLHLDAEGCFELEAVAPGRLVLIVHAPRGRNAVAGFRTELDLVPGTTTWARDVPCGSLQIEGLDLPPRPLFEESASTRWDLEWADGGGLSWYGFVGGAEEGRVLIPSVPVGRVVLKNEFSEAVRRGEEALVRLEVDVREGERAVVRLPRD